MKPLDPVFLLVFLIFLFLAWRSVGSSGVRTAKQALDWLGGWGVGMLGILVVLVFILPYIIRVGTPHTQSNWGGIINNARQGVSRIAPQSEPLPNTVPYIISTASPAPAPASTVSPPVASPQAIIRHEDAIEIYVVKAGDTLQKIADRFDVSVSDITSANSLSSPNLIRVGDELDIPVTVEIVLPTAVPTPEPPPSSPTPEPSLESASQPSGDLDSALADLAAARLDGDIDRGEEAIHDIIAIEPNHPAVVAERAAIDKAVELKEKWVEEGKYNLAVEGGFDEVLAGYSFVVVAYDEKVLTPKTGETMTVRCTTPGWMKDFEFDLSAYSVHLLGGNAIGDEFSVWSN